MIKQIYASLEISEREVRILVGEYFNTRFNILKLSKAPIEGIKEFRINNPDSVIKAINTCLEDIKAKLGTKLEKVILLVPPYKFKRIPLRVNVVPESGKLKKSDIARAITHTLETEVDSELMVVNRIPIKYSINGISYLRIPEDEITDEVIVDIDLLCAQKDLIYSYAQIVEKCGLEILDICLTNYASCKEGVLIEQSLNKNIVLIEINGSYCNLSLLSKGKLYNSEVVYNGIDSIISTVKTEFSLPYNTLLRLIKYNGGSDDNEDIIFAYNKDGKEVSITNKDLNDFISIPVKKLISDLTQICKPILESGDTMFVIEGEGADMVLLADKLKEETNAEIKIYHPDTLGVRESNLISLLGSFFVEKEKSLINEIDINCVDLLEFEKVVDQKKLDSEGETITTKIKLLFEQYMNKEK